MTGVKLLIISILAFTLVGCVTLGKTKAYYEDDDWSINQEFHF